MAKQKSPVNPFYVLLVFVGIVFLLTACAYGVMAFQADWQGRYDAAAAAPHPLLELLDARGGQILAMEIAVLAVATAAAIGLDRARQRKASKP